MSKGAARNRDVRVEQVEYPIIKQQVLKPPEHWVIAFAPLTAGLCWLFCGSSHFHTFEPGRKDPLETLPRTTPFFSHRAQQKDQLAEFKIKSPLSRNRDLLKNLRILNPSFTPPQSSNSKILLV